MLNTSGDRHTGIHQFSLKLKIIIFIHLSFHLIFFFLKWQEYAPTAGPTCQSLGHREGVHGGAGCGVNVVLLRHLVVQVEQHGADSVERIHAAAGRPAEIQRVHAESEDTGRLVT